MKSKKAKIFAALLCAAFVFLVIKKEANTKGEITVSIYDYDLKKGVKITLSDEDCRISFDLEDRVIRFLENSGKVSAAEIQAKKNMRDYFWFHWKFPERYEKLFSDPPWTPSASRDIVFMTCMDYTKTMQQKIEDAEARINSITREEIEKIFDIRGVVKSYGDGGTMSEKVKEIKEALKVEEILGRP